MTNFVNEVASILRSAFGTEFTAKRVGSDYIVMTNGMFDIRANSRQTTWQKGCFPYETIQQFVNGTEGCIGTLQFDTAMTHGILTEIKETTAKTIRESGSYSGYECYTWQTETCMHMTKVNGEWTPYAADYTEMKKKWEAQKAAKENRQTETVKTGVATKRIRYWELKNLSEYRYAKTVQGSYNATTKTIEIYC